MWRDLGKCGRLERDQQDVLNAEVTGLIRHAVRGPTDNALRRFQHKAIALERRRRFAARVSANLHTSRSEPRTQPRANGTGADDTDFHGCFPLSVWFVSAVSAVGSRVLGLENR